MEMLLLSRKANEKHVFCRERQKTCQGARWFKSNSNSAKESCCVKKCRKCKLSAKCSCWIFTKFFGRPGNIAQEGEE